MNPQSTKTLSILAIVAGLSGLAIYAVSFLPPAVASVEESGTLAILAIVLLLLLVGGPVSLGSLVFSFSNFKLASLLFSLLFLAGFIFVLVLARPQKHTLRRWALFAFFVPFIPPIILGIQNLRGKKAARPAIRPSYQPAPAAVPPAPSESLASIYFQQGQEFQWQGRYDEAIARYQQVLRSEPNNAQAYEQMGICYIHMGWKDDAKACLEKAAQLDPKIAEAIKKQ
jgi:hypothetical protein